MPGERRRHPPRFRGVHGVARVVSEALLEKQAFVLGDYFDYTACVAEAPWLGMWDGTRADQQRVLSIDRESRTARYLARDWHVLPMVWIAVFAGRIPGATPEDLGL